MILTLTTAALYVVAIQYKKGGAWVMLKPLALFTALIDIIANYTEVAIVFGKPKPGQETISRRIKAMANDPDELPARRELARMVQVFLDACEPDGKH